MNLLKFLKKEPAPFQFDKDKNSIELLNGGILFEENGDFLQWDIPIEQSKLYNKKGYRADRTIYDWGDKTILKGLQLPLSTILWKHKDDGSNVPSIEFSAVQEDAEKYFNVILSHLENIFGSPKTIEEEPGKLLEWKVGIVKITLNWFEQYHTDKLLFQIGRI